MTKAIAASTPLPTAKLDLKYHPGMDISTPSGFASGPQFSPDPEVSLLFCFCLAEASLGVSAEGRGRGLHPLARHAVQQLGINVPWVYFQILVKSHGAGVSAVCGTGKHHAVQACQSHNIQVLDGYRRLK